MLIPRYSIRRILALTTVAAVFALFAGLAARGSIWAAALLIGIGAMALVLLVQAALFGVVWLVGLAIGGRQGVAIGDRPGRDGQTPVARMLPWLLVGVLWMAHPASAVMPQVLNLPDAKVKPLSGFRIALDGSWVQTPGYRPVTLIATAVAASSADRTLTVRFRAGNWYRRGFHTTVEQDIEVPAGATIGKGTLAVPQFEPWTRIALDVWVDGTHAEELSSNQGDGSGYYPYYYNQNIDHGCAVLVIGEVPEVLRTGAAIASEKGRNNPSYYPGFSGPFAAPQVPTDQQVFIHGTPDEGNVAAKQLAANAPYLAALPPASLPTRWIDFSCLDVVLVSAVELQQLPVTQPAAWEALRRWLAAGGNLWVLGAGQEWQHLAAVEQLLDFPGMDKDTAGDPTGRGWRLPTIPDRFLSATDSQEVEVEGIEAERFGAPTLEGAAIGDESEVPLGPGQRIIASGLQNPPVMIQLLRRDYQLGEVVVFAADEPFRKQAWLPQDVGDPFRYQWVPRHGLVPNDGEHDFWNLLIPDVGLAPVTGFRVLISIFVVAIGPVNYWLLRRWGRLHLLLLTVPVSAALVAAVLFGYAILSDGLATRLRVRSYTEIDQASGGTVCWSRQSYYAGLAPRDGMRLPADTVMLPLLPRTGNSYEHSDVARRFVDWGQHQHLKQGWLSPRTPTQYVAVRSRTSSHKLDIQTHGDGLQVVNQLGTRIANLVVIDDSDKAYVATDVAPGGSIALASSDAGEACEVVRRAFRDARPQFPPEMANAENSGFFRRRYGYGNTGAASQSTSRLEVVLEDVGVTCERLTARTYLAIVDQSPEVVSGLIEPEEQSSLHVIFGRW